MPDGLDLDPFSERYCDVLGIPLVTHADVDPRALEIAAETMRIMLAARPDVAAAIAASPVRIGLIGRDQQTTDMPEWSDLNEAFPDTDWNERARGLGATFERPLAGGAEENVLCLPEDRYLGENIFVHEFAHVVHQFGIGVADDTFNSRLADAWVAAVDDGLWADTYAIGNPDEYFAEGVQSFFDTNLADDFQHNHVDTREELAEYDPVLHALIVEAVGEPDWRWSCP